MPFATLTNASIYSPIHRSTLAACRHAAADVHGHNKIKREHKPGAEATWQTYSRVRVPVNLVAGGETVLVSLGELGELVRAAERPLVRQQPREALRGPCARPRGHEQQQQQQQHEQRAESTVPGHASARAAFPPRFPRFATAR